MYIIELFFKIKESFKKRKVKENTENEDSDDSLYDNENACDHLFVPIDSTGRILACSKCGMIYKLKKNEVNPFKN